MWFTVTLSNCLVVEAYRLDRYDNFGFVLGLIICTVVEAYRLDRYDNFASYLFYLIHHRCRSLSFG